MPAPAARAHRAQGRREPPGLRGGQSGRELLDAGQARLVEALERDATGGGAAQALHAPVGAVLAAADQLAVDERVDRTAGARQRQPELLGELLDRQLGVGERAERLDLREREVELLEDRVRAHRVGAGDAAPEGEQLRGELGGVVVVGGGRGRRRQARCLHARKYCTDAVVAFGYLLRVVVGIARTRARVRLV
jgi:hypothetical protein